MRSYRSVPIVVLVVLASSRRRSWCGPKSCVVRGWGELPSLSCLGGKAIGFCDYDCDVYERPINKYMRVLMSLSILPYPWPPASCGHSSADPVI